MGVWQQSTLVFYLLDSGQDQIINSAFDEAIQEFLGFKATLFVDNIAKDM